MIDVEKTGRYDHWISTLRDRTAAAIVTARVERTRKGLMGDVKPVGAGVGELRIDYGPGYRVYFTDAVFQEALQTAARARGMSEVARTAGLGRESLYKALQVDAQPRFATVRKVMAALGVQLAVVTTNKRAAKKRPAIKRSQQARSGVVPGKKAAAKSNRTKTAVR